MNFRSYSYSILWNLLLITIGATLYAWGIRAVADVHGFIPGGLFGTAALVEKVFGQFDTGTWFFILNIPMFLLGWFKVSRKFCLYTLYAMIVSTVAYKVCTLPVPVVDEFYAAIACGIIMGSGGGLIFRSLGAGGGLDIIGVMLNQRYGLGIGKFFFVYNIGLFATSIPTIGVDKVITSLIAVFITSVLLEQVLGLFNQRKVVFIISTEAPGIAEDILHRLRRSATFLRGYGAYSGKERDVLMTVVSNVNLKKLEQITFTRDPNALFIVENTFSVLGAGFSKRKVY